MQTQLTNSLVQVQIAENEGEADLARARKQAEQIVVTAQAESQQRILAGRGEGARILQVGLSEASVLLRKIQSFSDPRLYALSVVAENLAKSTQPLVPERVFIAGGGGATAAPAATAAGGGRRPAAGSSGCCSACWSPRSRASSSPSTAPGNVLQEFADKISQQAMENMQEAMAAGCRDRDESWRRQRRREPEPGSRRPDQVRRRGEGVEGRAQDAGTQWSVNALRAAEKRRLNIGLPRSARPRPAGISFFFSIRGPVFVSYTRLIPCDPHFPDLSVKYSKSFRRYFR